MEREIASNFVYTTALNTTYRKMAEKHSPTKLDRLMQKHFLIPADPSAKV